MNRMEVLRVLHEYTPWEELHREHPDKADNMGPVNAALERPITEEQKMTGLHLPRIPDLEGDMFSKDIFFRYAPGQDIMIVQHDRYTPAMLHRHDYFELLYVYEGEFVQQINTEQFLMQTGDFCLVPPLVYHSLDVQNYSVVLNFLIPKPVFENIFLRYLPGDNILSTFFVGNVYTQNVNDYILFHTFGDQDIQDLVLSMCEESLNHERYFNHMLNVHLLTMFGLLLRRYENSCVLPKIKRKQDSQDFAILRYLEDHYQTVTLDDLADTFHYSSQHISHRLEQITGMSFTQYITRRKMEETVNLLLQTSMKIKDIGETVGYRNQEHFIRTFRKNYGCSPGEYRSRHRLASGHQGAFTPGSYFSTQSPSGTV